MHSQLDVIDEGKQVSSKEKWRADRDEKGDALGFGIGRVDNLQSRVEGLESRMEALEGRVEGIVENIKLE